MLVEAKFISLEVQYIDSTKIEANANKYTFVWKKSTQTNQGKLDVKVRSILREAERVLDMEIKDDKDVVMTSEQMRERTEAIIEEMDKRGISDKQLRRAAHCVESAIRVNMIDAVSRLIIVIMSCEL